jgi:tripeptidyl-peptidase-1
MATDQFGSGGGFSAQFGQSPNAKWQSAAVAKYLSTVDPSTLPPADSFPAMGRATPDVSALGEGYQVFVNGKAESVGGTSASSPAFASMVSLLNEARLNAGKPAMGFLNPFLYTNADAFTDVVKGSNKVGRGGQALAYGFNCSAGWDPATGLGTPLFDKLLAAAMA